MKRVLVSLSVVFAMAGSSPAVAVNVTVEIGRSNALENGFQVSLKKDDARLLVWTIERDLSKSRSFPEDSEMTIRRRATLTLYGTNGSRAEIPLEGTISPERPGVVSYWFKTSRELAPDAHLTVTEHLVFKDPSRGPILGGGTYFELPLSKLVDFSAITDGKGR